MKGHVNKGHFFVCVFVFLALLLLILEDNGLNYIPVRGSSIIIT